MPTGLMEILIWSRQPRSRIEITWAATLVTEMWFLLHSSKTLREAVRFLARTGFYPGN
jgi:hypothetical protein